MRAEQANLAHSVSLFGFHNHGVKRLIEVTQYRLPLASAFGDLIKLSFHLSREGVIHYRTEVGYEVVGYQIPDVGGYEAALVLSVLFVALVPVPLASTGPFRVDNSSNFAFAHPFCHVSAVLNGRNGRRIGGWSADALFFKSLY